MQPGAQYSFAEHSLAETDLHTGTGSAAAFGPCTDIRTIMTLPITYRQMPALKKQNQALALISVPPSRHIGWAGGIPSACRSALQFQLLLREIFIISTFIIWPHFSISEILKLKF